MGRMSSLFIALTWALSLSSAVHGSITTDIMKGLDQAVDCNSCLALLIILDLLARLGDSAFIKTLITICKNVEAEDPDVCEGTIEQQGPIIAHDLRKAGAFGPSAIRLCNSLIGLCQQPAVIPYAVSFGKPIPASPKVWSSTGKTPFQVVHFSDVHIDRRYTIGAEANCTKPICCRNYADHSGPVRIASGPMGSHGCDTPTSLAHSMMQAVKGQNTKFSIFTGDVVEAAVWLVNEEEVTSDLRAFNTELATLLDSPVYPAVGNHEVAPINSFPRDTSTDVLSSQWVFDTLSQGWNPWIGSVGTSSVQHMSGSYATLVPGTNLKIISLNTIYWYKHNFYLFDSDVHQPDPNGIIAFAAGELQASEDAGQRAWIIGHLPPGSVDAILDQSNYFNQIVQRYNNTIAAQFYGHTHADEFEIAYSDYSEQTANTATSVAYIAPSLTPRNANPAFRVYDVDPGTYEIMDSRTLISDMSDPSFQSATSWKLEYSARDVYGAAIGGWPANQSLTPAFWHRVTAAFVSNDSLFQQFVSFMTRGFDVSSCTDRCKTDKICGLRALRAENGCHVPVPGFHFRRDNGQGNIPHSDCEAINLPRILAKMAHNIVSVFHSFIIFEVEATGRQKTLRANISLT